jgi:hypothetical protein
MIQDFDKTIEKAIYELGRLSRTEVDVSFEQPNGEWSARINRPTVNVWCFDMVENVKLRHHSWEFETRGQTAVGRIHPMRFDLTYLVTAWARKVEDEHNLLWRALSALVQVREIEPERAEGLLKDQPFRIPLLVGHMPERTASLSDLWSVLNNQMRLGFTFVVTLALDPSVVVETPITSERRMRFGQALDARDGQLSASDADTVFDGSDDQYGGHGKNVPANGNGSSDQPADDAHKPRRN